MPLYANHAPIVALPLHSFDHTVWRVGYCRQSGRKSSDRLMVKRVHGELLGTEGRGETRVCRDVHVVYAFLPRPVSVVRQRAGPLGGDVLHEGSAQRHIDDLDTAADRERGQASRLRREDQGKLQCVAFTMDVAKAVMRERIIPLRLDVLASGEQQTVHSIQQGVGLRRVDDGKHVRAKSDRDHGVRVRRIGANAQHAANDFRGGSDSDGREQTPRWVEVALNGTVPVS